MAPADSAVACGGVSRLVNEGTPKPPRLDSVVVPPCRSGPVSLPVRALAMVARIRASCSSIGNRSGSRMTGANNPIAVSAANATPTVSFGAAGALAASSQPALTWGYWRMALARPRINSVVQPIRPRTRLAASRSSSVKTVNCGIEALAVIVRAMADRMALRRGASASANPGSSAEAAGAAAERAVATGAAAGGAATGAGGGAGAAAGTGAAGAATAPLVPPPTSSTSSTVMTPPGPVARTSSSETLSSAARRRAFGTAGSGPLRETGVAALGPRADPFRSGPAGATSEPGAAGSLAPSGGGSNRPAIRSSDSLRMNAMGAPTSTTSPGWATRRAMTPSTGDSTSMSTLSVCTSASTSPDLTVSPAATDQEIISPVSIVMLIFGMGSGISLAIRNSSPGSGRG